MHARTHAHTHTHTHTGVHIHTYTLKCCRAIVVLYQQPKDDHHRRSQVHHNTLSLRHFWQSSRSDHHLLGRVLLLLFLVGCLYSFINDGVLEMYCKMESKGKLLRLATGFVWWFENCTTYNPVWAPIIDFRKLLYSVYLQAYVSSSSRQWRISAFHSTVYRAY